MTSHPLSNAQKILIAKNKAQEAAILAAMWKLWKREGSELSFSEWLISGKNEGCENKCD